MNGHSSISSSTITEMGINSVCILKTECSGRCLVMIILAFYGDTEEEIFHVEGKQLYSLPVTSKEIRNASSADQSTTVPKQWMANFSSR